ncbi:hypothetical protein BH23GEM8_BH23GEM8_06420 [soil metagenome]
MSQSLKRIDVRGLLTALTIMLVAGVAGFLIGLWLGS